MSDNIQKLNYCCTGLRIGPILGVTERFEFDHDKSLHIYRMRDRFKDLLSSQYLHHKLVLACLSEF